MVSCEAHNDDNDDDGFGGADSIHGNNTPKQEKIYSIHWQTE